MRTLAIVGASYLQLPLVRKAKEMGLRTICFAWEDGAVCKPEVDRFYPISIVDKDRILEVCREERIDGITSIASDVAVPTMAYVASKLGLVGNSVESAAKSTNKYLMREAFAAAGVSVPRFAVVSDVAELERQVASLRYPLIVKPTDRSGSMGVTKVDTFGQLVPAVEVAVADSFCKKAVVEECITDMHEVSVEGISWEGEYHLLQITDKITTGAPHYVELGHHQPAELSGELRAKIIAEAEKGVKALEVQNGATHAELMITAAGEVYVTEIGARMGGDFIGSDLVRLSTGYDFVRGVIEVALGEFSGLNKTAHAKCSGVWFYAPQTKWVKEVVCSQDDSRIVFKELQSEDAVDLTRSADRSGYFVYASNEGRILPPGKEK